MSDNKLDRDAAKAMAYLKAQCAVNGVAAINFSDGEMFMFSRALIEDLKRQIEEKGSDEAIVFVQRGQVLREN